MIDTIRQYFEVGSTVRWGEKNMTNSGGRKGKGSKKPYGKKKFGGW